MALIINISARFRSVADTLLEASLGGRKPLRVTILLSVNEFLPRLATAIRIARAFLKLDHFEKRLNLSEPRPIISWISEESAEVSGRT